MKIQIYTKNTSLTPGIEEYIREKMEKLARRFDNIIQAEVQLEVFKNKHKGDDLQRVEIMVSIPKKRLRADHRAGEMHEAFDLALPKIERQLERYKDGMRKRDKTMLRRLGSVFSPFRAKQIQNPADEIVDRGGVNFNHKLTEMEARIELRQSKKPYLVYLNAETNKMNVIYKIGKNRFGVDEEK